MRARAASASASVRQTTAYDDPLPASSAGAPAAALDRRLERDEPRLHVVRGRLEIVAERRQPVDVDGLAYRAAERVPRAVHVGGRAAERRRRDHDRELGQDHRARDRRRPRAPASRRGRAGRTARRLRAWPRCARRRGSGGATPATVGAPMSTAAASAEPPPSPAPGGMPLCSSIADVRSERVARPAPRGSCRRSARRRRTRPSPRSTVSAAGRITSSSCGSLTDTTSIVELVVAVGARARDVQRERELGERVEPAPPGGNPVTSVCASAAHCDSVSVSARARGSMPARWNTHSARSGGVRWNAPSSARRSILRRVAKPGANELEHALGIGDRDRR